MVCMDDKAVIPVGDLHGMPLSTGVRPHNRVLAPTEGPELACGNGPWLLHQWSCLIFLKSHAFPYSHNEIIKKKVHTRPMLQNQKSNFFLLDFFLKKPPLV